MKHKYELNRRYEFTATADSVCPVPDDAKVIVWISGVGRSSPQLKVDEWCWDNRSSITHFLVTSYPKTKHKGWVNCHPSGRMFTYNSKRAADENASPTRIKCVEIEWDAE